MEKKLKKQRNAIWSVISLLLIGLLLSGCGGGNSSGKQPVDKPFDVSDVTGENSLSAMVSSEGEGGESRQLTYTLTYTYPKLSGGEKGAADAINATIENALKFWMDTDGSIFVQQAELIAPDADLTDEMPWSDEMNYGISRNDGKVFSMSLNTYLYAGGAHGMPGHAFLNFNSKTGAQLTLKDIAAVDETTLTQEVNAILVQQCEAMEQQPDNPLFDNWRDFIHMVLSDGTWYLDDNGFHTMAEVYMLAPYSYGPVDFCIPYEECSFMKEEYRK